MRHALIGFLIVVGLLVLFQGTPFVQALGNLTVAVLMLVPRILGALLSNV